MGKRIPEKLFLSLLACGFLVALYLFWKAL